MKTGMMIVGLAMATFPAYAQDIPSPYESAITDHAQIQLQSNLAKRRLQQAQARQQAQASDRPAAILSAAEKRRVGNACNNRKSVASRMTPADGRELYRLCAKAGY